MKHGLSTLVACSALVLGMGCGSSGKSSSSSTPAGNTASPTSSSGQSTGLKVSTKPKYAAPSPSVPVQDGAVQVAFRNITIDPDTLKVRLGSTIKWTNYDSVEHNVTSKEGPQQFRSGNFGEGKTFEVTVTKPGVIHYECTIHPTTMNGTIEVVK
jgi:plastocyanin